MKNSILKKMLFAFLLSLGPFIIELIFQDSKWPDYLEMKTFDERMRLRTKDIHTHKDIIVILIDEASLNSLEPLVGRWPWPRRVFAELLNFLNEAGAKAVLFDILFTEVSIPRDQMGQLSEDDQSLVEATANFENAIHAVQILEDTEDEYNKSLLNRPLPESFIKNYSLPNVKYLSTDKSNFNKYYLPFKELQHQTQSIGIVEFSADRDGVYRRSELIRKYQNHYFPVLSTSFYLKNKQTNNIILKKNELLFNGIKIPLQDNGRYLINMKKDFVNYSMSGIMATIQKLQQGDYENLIVDPAEFEDKIILVGASAAGVEDLKMTSYGKYIPGVYLHASIINNLLNKNFINKYKHQLIYFLIFIICFLISLLIISIENLWPSLTVFISFILIYSYFTYWILDTHQIWLPLALPVMMLFATYLISYMYKTLLEEKDKKFLKKAFSNYISPDLINMMYLSGTLPKLGGDVGIRTAFFTDIQGFSTFSERLNASKLVELLNEYLSFMTDILLKEGGTLDKYEGDAIIAFFGAPMPLEDHAIRACKVAQQMQDKLSELRKKWKSEGDKWPEIVHNMRMRIGINSGEMVTGNMGSKVRMNYTMMGDTVNLAARLEEAAKQYGIFTHISENTKEMAESHFEFRELDTIRVVGKSLPVTTYDLLGPKGDLSENLLLLKNNFHEGIKFYKEQKWNEALNMFHQNIKYEVERFPQIENLKNPSKIYISRCEHFINNPPTQDWDGVFTLTSK